MCLSRGLLDVLVLSSLCDIGKVFDGMWVGLQHASCAIRPLAASSFPPPDHRSEECGDHGLAVPRAAFRLQRLWPVKLRDQLAVDALTVAVDDSSCGLGDGLDGFDEIDAVDRGGIRSMESIRPAGRLLAESGLRGEARSLPEAEDFTEGIRDCGHAQTIWGRAGSAGCYLNFRLG